VSWRDSRIRDAEDALAAAVREADEIIADVPEPPRPEEPASEELEAPTIMRDAW
jgi:hypothetical protein